MKSIQNLFNSLFLYSSLFAIANTVDAQSKFSVSTGIGLAEAINVGAHFNSGQFQTGIRFGIFSTGEVDSKTLTLDLAYHMLGTAKFSERRPWYIKASLHFTKDSEVDIGGKEIGGKYVMTSLKFGREFNLTRKVSFYADAGYILILSDNSLQAGWFEDIKDDFRETVFLLPNASLGISYKF